MKIRRGFTILEVVAVIGLLCTLFAVGAPDAVRIKHEINQKEADEYAEIKYMDESNTLISMNCRGVLSSFNKRTTSLNYDPEGYVGEGLAYYITDNYLVEYDTWSGWVYGVFYANDCDFSFYTNSTADEYYRYLGMQQHIEYTMANSNKQIIAYYGGGSMSCIKPVIPPEEIKKEEEKDRNYNLYLADGLVYWEQYEDLSYGVYYIYDCALQEASNVDCLQNDQIVIADGYGMAVSKSNSNYIYLDRKATNNQVYEYCKENRGSADIESSTGYLFKFPKEWSDEAEESSGNGYFYTRLGIWVFNEKQDNPYTLLNPVPIYVNMRTAKSGIVCKKGQTSPTYDSGGNFTEDIIIRSARQLYDLSLYYTKFIASAETIWCVQECNIDYSKYNWSENTLYCVVQPSQYPIGYGDSIVDKAHKNTFMCNYDGEGHYISGLNIKAIGGYSGLFSILRDYPYRDSKGKPLDTGIVKNLTIKNSSFEDAKYKGAIAGYVQDNAKISNCSADISLYGGKGTKAIIE